MSAIELFTTAPESVGIAPGEYPRRVSEVARWSEAAGCVGILVYTDNRLIDPWLVAQEILRSTRTLAPLVATQPVYMHPYSVAKMIATLGHLHGRRLCLNMVAGGFKNDLLNLGDETPHDLRYARLEEYTAIVCGLLRGAAPVTLAGRFYNVRNLTLQPALAPELFPALYLSGSSEAGRAAASALGAIAVEYPQPGGSYPATPAGAAAGRGMRIGIITAPDDAEAWRLARERFPEDRRGQIAHRVAMRVSDSAWHADLGGRGEGSEEHDSPYWLGPFQNYQSFCPYLVGSHERVAAELATYLRAGFRTFILDIPRRSEDVEPLRGLFQRAEVLAG